MAVVSDLKGTKDWTCGGRATDALPVLSHATQRYREVKAGTIWIALTQVKEPSTFPE